MGETSKLNSLNAISLAIGEKDREIWTNIAHSICIKRETEKIHTETTRLKRASETLQKNNLELKNQIEALKLTQSVQQQTLHISQQSQLNHLYMCESLRNEAKNLRVLYSDTLKAYEDELEDYRLMYENSSKGYKDLQIEINEMKKTKIKYMVLQTTVKRLHLIQQQFLDIKQQICRSTIVKFAKLILLYQKYERLSLELEESKKNESQLVQQHWASMQKQNKRGQDIKTHMAVNFPKTDKKLKVQIIDDKMENINQEYELSEKVKEFMKENFQPFALTCFDSQPSPSPPPVPIPSFNKDNGKVRILDMKTIVPKSLQVTSKNDGTNVIQKNINNIVETSSKTILGSHVSEKIPIPILIRSQDKEKSLSQDKSSQNDLQQKNNSQKSVSSPTSAPILKQLPNFETFEQNPENISEQSSKYFMKKKTVTFQNENKIFSQESSSIFGKPTGGQFGLFGNNSNSQKEKTGLRDMFKKPFSLFNKIDEEGTKNENTIKCSPFDFFGTSKLIEDNKSTGNSQIVSNDFGSTALSSSPMETGQSTAASADTEISPQMFNESNFADDDFDSYRQPNAPESTSFFFRSQKPRTGFFNMFQ